MTSGYKNYITFSALAAGTAMSAFMYAAEPAMAQDMDMRAAEDIECPEDTPVRDLTDAQRESCLGDDEEDNSEKAFVVRLHGGLKDNNAEDIIEDLREFAAEDPDQEITFYINSFGGALSQAFAIYDTMQDIPNDIRTICEGKAMSAGMFLLTAGTPGKRQALPNCNIMAHQSSGAAMGHIEDTRLRVEYSEELNEKFVEIIARHSGWDVDTLTDIMSHDAYLTAEQAIDMGFIDSITEPVKPTPQLPERTQDDLPDWFCEGERGRVMRICAMP